MPEAVLAQINRMSRRRKVPAGRAIFGNDESSPQVATIMSGVVKLSKSLPDGRIQLVGLLFPGEFLGRPFSGPDSLLVEAATPVEVCSFSQRHFETLLADNAELQSLFVRRTIEDLDSARAWMLLLGRKTAEERVASLVLMCLEKSHSTGCGDDPADADDVVDLPLSRTEMAQFLGLTIETVGRMLKRLEGNGVFTIDGGRRLIVKDPEALRLSAQQELC